MFYLKKQTKDNISQIVGMEYSKICEVASSEEIGVDVHYSRESKPLVFGRGNPYLAKRRFSTVAEAEARMMKTIEETRHESKSKRKGRANI